MKNTKTLPILNASTLVACATALCMAAGGGVALAQDAGQVTLNINMDKPGVSVSPTLYGLMTEEINHGYDGGLYAELIQNRVFRDDDNNPVHWTLVQDGGAGTIALDKTQPLNDALPVSLKLDVTQGGTRVGVANDGFWGIPVKPSTTYCASFYAKASGIGGGPVTVDIESADGHTVYAKGQVAKITNGWQRYEVPLTTDAGVQPTAAARFVISTTSAGTLWLDLVSLFPPTYNNRPNGNRVDIMQLMVDMHPKFLRLPGGNYLEGNTIDTRFPWKKTLGPLDQRPGHPGTWSYRSSDGLGLLEYLDWCEDMKAEPVLAVFAGYALNKTTTQPGPALQPFIDEALEEIEYVTGGPETKWGAERAKDGHPAPFHLTYVEIGNEDFFDKSGSYNGRYSQFYNAIKAKYPDLQLIATTKVNSMKPDVVDEHYYLSTGDMEDMATKYDHYSRSGPKVFDGEWATRRGPWKKPTGTTPNLGDALADAAWMTGLERNSDIVVMQCYAPLFVNVNPGARQWDINLIGYDALHSYGSPSYYAQQMFGTHLGDKVVPIELQNVGTQVKFARKPTNPPKMIPTVYAVATRDSKTGTIYLKVVNTVGTPQDVKININGAQQVASQGTAIVLAADDPEETNTVDAPTHVIPVSSSVSGLGTSFTHTFAPYSATVLQFQAR
jgi:alpha-N-arabinofuranosidase